MQGESSLGSCCGFLKRLEGRRLPAACLVRNRETLGQRDPLRHAWLLLAAAGLTESTVVDNLHWTATGLSNTESNPIQWGSFVG